MITLLIYLLVIGGIAAILQVAPIPEPFKRIGYIIIFIVFIIYLLQFITGTTIIPIR